MIGIVAGLLPFADEVEHAVAAQGVGVVLDPHRGGLRGAQGIDAEQVGERAVVHREDLGDLEEPDELSRSSLWVRGSSRCTFGSRA